MPTWAQGRYMKRGPVNTYSRSVLLNANRGPGSGAGTGTRARAEGQAKSREPGNTNTS